MMLLAIMAAIDEGDAEVNHLVQPAVERSAHAGVEREEILQHLRTVRQRLLRISRFATQSFFVNLFYFGTGIFSFDQRDACHWNLDGNENRTPYNKARAPKALGDTDIS